jgi:hypothetical protein
VYSSTYNVANVFSDNLVQMGDGGTLGQCTATFVPTKDVACLIDPALENATAATTLKSGYFFTYTPAVGTYGLLASPGTVNSTGVRFFFTDQTLVIRANAGSAATSASAPI